MNNELFHQGLSDLEYVRLMLMRSAAQLDEQIRRLEQLVEFDSNDICKRNLVEACNDYRDRYRLTNDLNADEDVAWRRLLSAFE